MYYVTFLITNTYGKDIHLRTSFPPPFDKIAIIHGQTVRLTVKVLSQEDVTFEAFVAKTGEKITINGQFVFSITPQESRDVVTVLRVPEFLGMFPEYY